jgi:DNA-binding PadR family transcriptional regulator
MRFGRHGRDQGRDHGHQAGHHGDHRGLRRVAMMRGGEERGFGGRGFGGGGRRRVFDGGELKLVLLSLIDAQPRHGYDLIRAIEELSGGAYAPSPGVVYPTLTLLDDMGLIEELKAEGARKQFTATEEGRALIAEKAAEIAALKERLAALGAFREKT